MADENTEILGQILEALKSANGGGKIHPKSANFASAVSSKDVNEFKKYLASLKDSHKTVSKLNDMLEDLEEQIEETTNAEEKAALAEKRRMLEQERFYSGLATSLNAFGKSLATSSKMVAAGAVAATGTLMKSVTSGGDAFDTTSQIMGVAGQAVGAVGKAFGGVVSALGEGTPVIGGFVKALGAGISGVSELASKAMQEGSKLLMDQLRRSVKAYGDTSAAGAMFADGIEGMRNSAYQAGMTTEMFAKTVKNSAANIATAGLGVTDGIKELGKVSAYMAGSSGIRGKLMNLGYAIEEHGDLIATVMADMSRTNPTKKRTDQEVADATMKYAENLRLIASITGEDAKKKMEEARAAANTLAFQQKLAKKSPEEQARITQAMATMTAQQKQNFMDMVNFGAVINKNGAIMESQIPAQAAMTQQFAKMYKDGTMSVQTVAEAKAAHSEAIRIQAEGAEGIATAGVALSGSVAEAVSKSILETWQDINKYTLDSIYGSKEGVEKQRDTTNEMTNSIREAQETMVKFTNNVENLLNKPMTKFADMTNELLKAIEFTVNKINEFLGTEPPKISEEAKRVAGTAGGMMTAESQQARMDQDDFIAWKRAKKEENFLNLPFWKTEEKEAQKARYQEDKKAGWTAPAKVDIIQEQTRRMMAEYNNAFKEFREKHNDIKTGSSQTPKEYAGGGISTGPESGYRAILHGTEAVVPLPDGDSIPVKIEQNQQQPQSVNNSAFTNIFNNNNELMKKQVDLMTQFLERTDDLIDAINEQKSIQQNILNASY